MDGQIGDLVALLLQALEGVEHGVVLKGGGDDVALILGRPQPGAGADCLVVALAAAGGEVDLLGLCAQDLRHARPGIVQGLLGGLPQAVEAGGVAPQLRRRFGHDLEGPGTHPRGGRVVSIYHGKCLL